jgi:MFS transporter, SP family, sugar:H+ symporter
MVGENKAHLGPKVFFVWGSLCAVAFVYAYFLIPETKGLSLEQVDRMFEETTPRHSAKWVPHSTFAADMGMAVKVTLPQDATERAETSTLINADV